VLDPLEESAEELRDELAGFIGMCFSDAHFNLPHRIGRACIVPNERLYLEFFEKRFDQARFCHILGGIDGHERARGRELFFRKAVHLQALRHNLGTGAAQLDIHSDIGDRRA
jgi:hypothetical protein